MVVVDDIAPGAHPEPVPPPRPEAVARTERLALAEHYAGGRMAGGRERGKEGRRRERVREGGRKESKREGGRSEGGRERERREHRYICKGRKGS